MNAATWSEIAGWYDDLLQAGSGPHELAVETTARPSPGISDVVCGQGPASRGLARAGADSVTGVDLSPEMVAAARRHEAAEPPSIDYRVEDATTPSRPAASPSSGVEESSAGALLARQQLEARVGKA
jgi:SAM-dependent methyltransferase